MSESNEVTTTTKQLSIAINKVNVETKKVQIEPGFTQIITFDEEVDNDTGIISLFSHDVFEFEPNHLYCLIFGKTENWPNKPDECALMSAGLNYTPPTKGTQFIFSTQQSKLIMADSVEVYTNKIETIIVKKSEESNQVLMMIRIHPRE